MELDKKFPANHFDCAYAIEATCHAPDLTQCYAQVFKVLKPGGRLGLHVAFTSKPQTRIQILNSEPRTPHDCRFATYEWLATDKYHTHLHYAVTR
jgi:hypothetical protein